MNDHLRLLLMAGLFPPVFLGIYHILPMVYVLWNPQRFSYRNQNDGEEIIGKVFRRIPIPEKLKDAVLSRLYESGVGDNRTWMYWIILTVFLPILSAIIMMAGGYDVMTVLLFSSGCFLLPNLYIRSRIAERQKAFLINAYKLYYFLHSQISAGIKSTDAVRGLHAIADHPLIHGTFVRFVAHFELTLNIGESLDIIRKAFKGYDAEMLCVSIRQCVETGTAGKTLLKMEQLMFAKYFYLLQKETTKYKTRLLISGLFAMAPMIILFSLPILYDAVKGFGDVLNASFS